MNRETNERNERESSSCGKCSEVGTIDLSMLQDSTKLGPASMAGP